MIQNVLFKVVYFLSNGVGVLEPRLLKLDGLIL